MDRDDATSISNFSSLGSTLLSLTQVQAFGLTLRFHLSIRSGQMWISEGKTSCSGPVRLSGIHRPQSLGQFQDQEAALLVDRVARQQSGS